MLAERLLAPLRTAGIDTLLLGCTHYPFLARTIADAVGRGVVLVSSADETAFDVRATLSEGRLGRAVHPPGEARFYSSGDVEWFRSVGSRLFGAELGDVGPVSWPVPEAVADDEPGDSGTAMTGC